MLRTSGSPVVVRVSGAEQRHPLTCGTSIQTVMQERCCLGDKPALVIHSSEFGHEKVQVMLELAGYHL